ncbi:hypothetical protein [Kiloniella sp. b19]|uniref:hypothetical protein n=1 Tax=Kiloniella sp. GXU_MW_B19 TaxID=3141326 RepID=UPI0031CFDB69
MIKHLAVKLKSLVLSTGLLLVSSGFVQAQESGAVAHGGEREFYMAFIPGDWHILPRQKQSERYYGEWIPKNQQAENWQDMIILQIFPGQGDESLQDSKRPEKALDRIAAAYKKNCSAMAATDALNDQVNGYWTGFRLIYCAQDLSGSTGEISLFRVTIGRNATYIIQRAFRVPGFELGQKPDPVSAQRLKEAFGIIRQGWICQEKTDRSCPENWAGTFELITSLNPAVYSFDANGKASD